MQGAMMVAGRTDTIYVLIVLNPFNFHSTGGNRMKKLSTIFAVLAILLSDVMCAVVAYNYCALEWGGKYEAWSAPASTALLLAIPYAIGIIICVVLAIIFKRKYM